MLLTTTTPAQLAAYWSYRIETMLTKVELLTTDTLLELFNLKSAYFLGYSWLLGMCTYCRTFIS